MDQFVLIVSSSCAANLSAGNRVLSYPATVTQTGSTAIVNLTGGQFTTISIQGPVSGTTYSPRVAVGDISKGPIGVLVMCDATLTYNGRDVDGSCSGQVSEVGFGSCNATDHRLILNFR